MESESRFGYRKRVSETDQTEARGERFKDRSRSMLLQEHEASRQTRSRKRQETRGLSYVFDRRIGAGGASEEASTVSA